MSTYGSKLRFVTMCDKLLNITFQASLLSKPQLADTNWTTAAAEEVIVSWQRAFTQLLYKHKHNFETTENGVEVSYYFIFHLYCSVQKERRTIHPLASTSIADMLEEFCQFNYTIILVGYGLMVGDFLNFYEIQSLNILNF